MWPFKRRAPAQLPELNTHPVHLNQPIPVARHLGRVARLMRAMQTESDKARLASYQDELDRRILMLRAAGVKVPRTAEEAEAMLNG